MIIKKRKCLLGSRCAGGRLDPIRHLLDLVSRVAIVVSFPRLLRVPPRFGVAPMSPEIKYLAHGLKFLSNGSPKLRLVDENPLALFPSKSALTWVREFL